MFSIAELGRPGISTLAKGARQRVMGSRFRPLVSERPVGGPETIANGRGMVTISMVNGVTFLWEVARLGPIDDGTSREIGILSPRTKVTYDERGNPISVTLQDPTSKKEATISKEGVVFQF